MLWSFAELAYKDIVKLYRQFGYCSVKKLSELIKKPNQKCANLSEIIESVTQERPVCQQHGKSLPGPVVTLTLSEEFNSVLAIDLH